jgi:hypothetical protein
MAENLKHFGILGMHWGIRRRNPHSDSTSVAPLKKKHVSELSNAELKTAINRMQLEKQFKELSSPAGGGRGKAFLSKLLVNIGTKAVNSYVSSVNGDSQSYDYFAQRVREAANNKKN